MFSFLFANVKSIATGLLGLFMLYVMGKNSKLKKENDDLNATIDHQVEKLERKERMIKVVENYKPTDIEGTIERILKENKKK